MKDLSMPNLSITDSSPSLTEEDIRALEDEFNLVLPSEYREFLLQYNGGTPNRRVFNYQNIRYGANRSSIQRFIPIDPNNSLDLIKLMSNDTPIIPSMPRSKIPFAYDPGGNVLCISLSANEFGEIFFWEHDMTEGEHFGFIANSFNEFLEGLYEKNSSSVKPSIFHSVLRWFGRK